MKNNNTKEARMFLQQAKDAKAQLKKLNLPSTELSQENTTSALLNLIKLLVENGDIGMAIEKFEEAKTTNVNADVINKTKDYLMQMMEEKATDATNEAKQAMKNKETVKARVALKEAKDIKAKMEQLK